MAETRAARCIAIVGAESTGKTTLAQGLTDALRERTGQRVACVPEVLREWCAAALRAPQAHEQGAILHEQHARIAAARSLHDWVVCDTTALMTAVYSRTVFGDRSLEAEALVMHAAHVQTTLLTGLDLPWVPDGLQRDGPQVREPVDRSLRELMQAGGIAHAVVTGTGERRLQRALAAIGASPDATPASSARSTGLFSRLEPAPGEDTTGRWVCECCLPEQEQALKRLRQRQASA